MRIHTKKLACIVLSAAMVVTNGSMPVTASASTITEDAVALEATVPEVTMPALPAGTSDVTQDDAEGEETSAQNISEGDFEIEQDENITGDWIITKYNGSATVLDLKTIFAGKNIVRIGESAFAEHGTITEVILPDTVTSIGMNAFGNCSSLEKITFSSSLNVIGGKAFFGCRLSDITLPASCTSIVADAFWGNPLGVVHFLNQNTTVEKNAFPAAWAAENMVFCAPYSESPSKVQTYAGNNEIRFAYDAEKLTIQEYPKQKYYYEEDFDTDGMVLKATVSTGIGKKEIEVSPANCFFSHFNPESARPQTITVRYGTQTVSYPVNVYYDLSNAYLKRDIEDQTYTGSEIEPNFTLMDSNRGREISKDKYTIEWKGNHTDVGEVTATLKGTAPATGSGCYMGETEISFWITKKSIDAEDIQVTVPDMIYTGEKLEPVPVVSYGAIALQEGRDYTVSYDSEWRDNTNVGTGELFLIGKGNYEGMKTVEFTILPRDLSEGAEIEDIPNQTYAGSGNEVRPSIRATWDGKTGILGWRDYSVKYTNNTQVGTACAILVGKGNYKGTVQKEFVIEPISILDASIGEILAQIYTGYEIMPYFEVTHNGNRLGGGDFTVFGQNNIDVGEATLTISGTGNVIGTVTKKFKIEPKSIEKAKIADISPVAYTGMEVKPEVTVTLANVEITDEEYEIAANDPNISLPFVEIKTLQPNVDYTVEYKNNILPGTATVIVTGKGNYCGTVKKEFEIQGISISDAVVTVPEFVVYNGKEQTPAVTVTLDDEKLVADKDYSLTYTDNKNAGTATVTVTGKGKYAGTVEKKFLITAVKLNESGFTAQKSVEYTTGKIDLAEKMKVNGTVLTKDVDYTITFEEDAQVGKAKAVVTGKGNYTGSFEYEFEVTAKDISEDAVVSGIEEEVTYTGKEITPEVTVKLDDITLQADEDYTVAYTNNKEVGQATVTITGMGNYTGSVEVSFDIVADASGANGGTNTGNNTTNSGSNAGTGSTGNNTQKTTIAAENVTVDEKVVYTGKTPDIDVEVEVGGEVLEEKVDYTVAYSNMDKPGVGTVTITGVGNYQGIVKKNVIILPGKVKISSVKAKKGNKAIAKWKKITGASGYEVSIATNKKFTANKQVKSSKGTSYTFKKLNKKKYFVRVRAYVSANGKKEYGAYSTVTAVTMSKN